MYVIVVVLIICAGLVTVMLAYDFLHSPTDDEVVTVGFFKGCTIGSVVMFEYNGTRYPACVQGVYIDDAGEKVPYISSSLSTSLLTYDEFNKLLERHQFLLQEAEETGKVVNLNEWIERRGRVTHTGPARNRRA